MQPSTPRHVEIWDVDKVLSYFNNKDHNNKISFKELCAKTVTLLMILGTTGKMHSLPFLLMLSKLMSPSVLFVLLKW